MAVLSKENYKKEKKKRKGVHAKTKTSNSKNSILYKKMYNSQGK